MKTTTRHTDVHGAFTALECLDRYGVVSLADLRPFCDLDRPEFDRQLNDLRRRGVLTMSALEGRHGATREQLDACLVEFGEQLLFVHRRR